MGGVITAQTPLGGMGGHDDGPIMVQNQSLNIRHMTDYLLAGDLDRAVRRGDAVLGDFGAIGAGEVDFLTCLMW